MEQTLSLKEIYDMLIEPIVLRILTGLEILKPASYVEFYWADDTDNTTAYPISCTVYYDQTTSYDLLHADDGICINYICRILCAVKNIRQGLPADSGHGCMPADELRFLKYDVYLYHMLQMDKLEQIENVQSMTNNSQTDEVAEQVKYVAITNDRRVGYKWESIQEFPEFEGL